MRSTSPEEEEEEELEREREREGVTGCGLCSLANALPAATADFKLTEEMLAKLRLPHGLARTSCSRRWRSGFRNHHLKVKFEVWRQRRRRRV